MRTVGRTLLLFSIAWATFWASPVCFAGEEDAGVTLVAGSTAEPSRGMRAGFTPARTHREVSEPAADPLPSGSDGRAPAEGWGGGPPAGRRATLARAGTAPSPPSDILLLIQRQNE